jgi:enoyl-CoA hydratase
MEQGDQSAEHGDQSAEHGDQSAVQGDQRAVQADQSATSDVLQSERIGGVLLLTFNRPQARNALNPELKDRLLRAMRDADSDPDVRAVVITGNGPIFCAGMDLKAFAGGAAFGGLTDFYANGIGKPLIAALNGPALGGGFEVALTCDLIIAPEQAWFALPEVKRGLFAAGGGTTLASRIPRAIALEIGLTGDPITASRALQIGLVNKVVPAEEVRPQALALAARIADNGPLAVALTKKLMRQCRWADAEETAGIFRSADALEGARAFAERRPPVWSGK